MAGLRFYTADVFTDRPFGGNPLAVFPDAQGLEPSRMQAIARELNLSETVFVFPPETTVGHKRLRIFTPGGEIPFAGHPTVGTAFVLAAIGDLPIPGLESGLDSGLTGQADRPANQAPNPETRPETLAVIFEEGVGSVPVSIRFENDRPVFAELAAAQAPIVRPLANDRDRWSALLGLDPSDLALDLQPAIASCGLPFTVIPLASVAALGRSRLDLGLWRQWLADTEAPQVYPIVRLTENRWRVRMFAPALGISEDPATGSAAAALGGYLAWADQAGSGQGTWQVTIDQGQEIDRPSCLELSIDQDQGQVTAIRVGGRSVLMSQAELWC